MTYNRHNYRNSRQEMKRRRDQRVAFRIAKAARFGTPRPYVFGVRINGVDRYSIKGSASTFTLPRILHTPSRSRYTPHVGAKQKARTA